MQASNFCRRFSRRELFCFFFYDLVGGVQGGGLLHHGAYRAILVFGEADGRFDGCRIDFVAFDHVMDADCGEDLRRAFGLTGFHAADALPA